MIYCFEKNFCGPWFLSFGLSEIQSYHPGGRDGMGLHWSFTIQSSSQMLLLFHVICFFKTGCFRCFKFSCFFHVICSIKTGCFRCFVFGYFFMSYVSSKLVASMFALLLHWKLFSTINKSDKECSPYLEVDKNCLMELLICLICELWSLILPWSVIFSESDLLIFDLWSVLKNWSAVIFDLLICGVHDLRPVLKVIFWS